MNCEQRRDLMVQLVVGSLDPSEAAELRTHLETGCSRCADSMNEIQQLQLALSLSPYPIEPSPETKLILRERLRPSADREPELTRDDTPVHRSPRPFQSWVVGALSAAAAGLVVFVLADLRLSELSGQHDALRADLDRLEADRTELQEELVALQSEFEVTDAEAMESEAQVRALESEVLNTAKQLAMLRSDSVVAMSIRGTASQPAATARVFWGEDYYCYLSVTHLRKLAEGRTYVFWLDTEDRGITFVGSLVPDANGSATLWVPLDRDLGKITRAFLTEEPAGDPGQEPTGAVELEST